MMEIFVINLERSVERRSFMRKQLLEQKLDFEFITAVDGANLSEDILDKICDYEEMANKRPWLLKKGVYGCLLSHLSIYQKMVKENISTALVLEDDVIINIDLKENLREIEKNIFSDEVILLFIQNNHSQIRFSNYSLIELKNNYQLVYPMHPSMLNSAAGYIITNEAARKMIDIVFPIRYAADDWNAFYNEKAIDNIRCVVPFLVKPAGLKSSIDYLESSSIVGRIMNFIDKENVFPFKQFLTWRRKKAIDKTSAYIFLNSKSLLDKNI